MARRVGSLSAEKVLSRLVEYLTIRLCIIPDDGACQGVAVFFDFLILEDLLRGVRLVASQGFEPRLIGSEPTVLPLNEEATS